MERIPIRQIQAARKESDLSESFSIRNITDLHAGEDIIQALHRHDFYYILALQKGSGNHEIDFTPYTVGDHSLFFMRPGQVHRLALKAGTTGYLMQFGDSFYFPPDNGPNRTLRKASALNYYQFTDSGFQRVHRLLTYIFQEYTGKKENYEEVIQANLGIFFIELSRQHSSAPSGPVNLYLQERLETFLELLKENFLRHKQVSDYAAMLNLSPYQLNAMTKATLGKTCSELINDHIVLEAKRQLLATSNQVNRIADHLGYEDVSYFIRFFKKQTGHSPEAFRHNFR